MSSAIKQGEAKHTPGPWEASRKYVKQTGAKPWWGIRSAKGVIASTVNSGSEDIAITHVQRSDRELEANARLIAAAPDLLADMRTIAAQSIGSDWTAEEAVAFIRSVARAAITKATT